MEDNIRKKKSKKYIYFIETHLSNEDEKIKINISIPPENGFIYSFEKIYHKTISREKEYICNIFKVQTKAIKATKENIEFKITLIKDKTNFES